MAVLLHQILVLFLFSLSTAKPGWPPQAQLSHSDIRSSIKRIYLVSSCHLDLGFADTLVNIVNEYFDSYFPNAIRIAEELRQSDHEERLVFTTHSYLVWLYFNCPRDSGLHCPGPDELQSFRTAVANGDIAWHAFPFNAQPEVYDSSLVDFGFRLTMNISRDIGYIPIAMSQRDVPGLTRSIIPIMRNHNVVAITVGVNTACMPPAVPSAFKWVDPVSGQYVIGMWHPHGYGSQLGTIDATDIVYVSGMSTALAFAIRSDNTGPPSVTEIYKNYENLKTLFPEAEIVASSYNEYVQELLDHVDLLPEYKDEIGDTWIHGVGSDPWKTTKYREMLRQRRQCLDTNACDINEQSIFDFSAYLLKYGEHTWGKDIKKFLHDTTNWPNEKFHQVHFGLNYIDVAVSWAEQRIWSIDYALDALQNTPLRNSIDSAIKELYFNGNINMDNFTLNQTCERVEFGPISISFDLDKMSIISLIDQRGTSNGKPLEYSGSNNPLALLTYNTYTGDDYKNFLEQYLLDKSLSYAYQDLGKPGLSDFDIDAIVEYPRVQHCWTKIDEESLTVRLQGTFSDEAVTKYGASQTVYLDIMVPSKATDDGIKIELTLYIVEKTSTRIPESLTVLFQPNPDLIDPKSLSVSKLGEYINVLDVIANGSKHVHASDEGIKYGSPVPLSVQSWDTEVITIGGVNLFPVPMETPDVGKGFGFNIYNNLWGTNYIMWYPYKYGEESSKYRFTMTLPNPQ